jgi:exonuclease SbcC
MIPISLTLSGFLSYRDPVEIDFTSFELACIAGPNGAGKSSILDAITWTLFGQARKRDDSLINNYASGAQAELVFFYENNFYRVQRTKPRDKTTMLEFHILQKESLNVDHPVVSAHLPNGAWKALTERTMRETERLIQDTLRLDYETFVNAAFFLQGKADQFTQQRPGDRKRILSSILGLEIWETYRQRAGEARRGLEVEISELDGRLREIVTELDEETERKRQLGQLEAELEQRAQERADQEAVLANFRQFAATLKEQDKLVAALARQVDTSNRQLMTLQERLEARQAEQQTLENLLARADQVQDAYDNWLALQADLARWDEVAARFRQHDERRSEPRTEIETARARLEQEARSLQERRQVTLALESEAAELGPQIETTRRDLENAQARLAQKNELENDLAEARQRLAEARSENPHLYSAMHELKGRIDRLKEADEMTAECPLCGQPLSPADRLALLASLESQGKEMGDRYRENQALLQNADQQVTELTSQIGEYARAQDGYNAEGQKLAALNSRMELIESQLAEWQKKDAPRLAEVELALKDETYAPEARSALAAVDAELKEIGYDAAAHDTVRRAEFEGRASRDEMRVLENARATLVPLEREIGELEGQIAAQTEQVEDQRREYARAQVALEEAQEQMPDLETAERTLLRLQEQENRLRLDLGAAQQKVLVLDDLKARRKKLDTKREDLARRIGQYKQLERAFGKDGVPALLIEQALPEIENKANEVLQRLSGGQMSVRFVTQTAYKDKRREDLRETLEIQISDSAGVRDYEMYSGGEAFRVNFAIRLALSEVLAQRAGARLQTLVIDEGFGSQDALGRQRLVEAINMVRDDFAKILVITHIDELKDVFPNRIDVEKTPRGSVVTVV